jgi:hypothetical protein
MEENIMSHWKWPDPSDRSMNDPSVTLTRERILGLHNSESGQVAQNITDKILSWTTSRAKEEGWDDVQIVVEDAHHVCVLTKYFH